jgi:arylsulfatase
MVSEYDTEAEKFKPWELYDLKTDRSEVNNVSTRFPDLITKMAVKYNSWADRVGVVAKETLDFQKK